MLMYYGNRMMGGGRYISYGWQALVCLAFLILIVLGIIALVRYIRFTGHGHKIEMPTVNPALQILQERYARGELSDEEYRVKKAELLK
ncbi:putative membrane protein [Sporobacter termitidis DSM 10068]|uniref:Putative membrane protein n=1 Tax=Sporobacter termitidis DSM 10068 TaxID=1123282 RepID=A0A1M5XPS5_9FIRM|nr:SHOCT domain-containing protein [Sporobacter termitidis]SHI01847.1 putative membrane protein [Sporobacter termitidis DSM 10068]